MMRTCNNCHVLLLAYYMLSQVLNWRNLNNTGIYFETIATLYSPFSIYFSCLVTSMKINHLMGMSVKACNQLENKTVLCCYMFLFDLTNFQTALGCHTGQAICGGDSRSISRLKVEVCCLFSQISFGMLGPSNFFTYGNRHFIARE